MNVGFIWHMLMLKCRPPQGYKCIEKLSYHTWHVHTSDLALVKNACTIQGSTLDALCRGHTRLFAIAVRNVQNGMKKQYFSLPALFSSIMQKRTYIGTSNAICHCLTCNTRNLFELLLGGYCGKREAV